jgi:hypothetical protein
VIVFGIWMNSFVFLNIKIKNKLIKFLRFFFIHSDEEQKWNFFFSKLKCGNGNSIKIFSITEVDWSCPGSRSSRPSAAERSSAPSCGSSSGTRPPRGSPSGTRRSGSPARRDRASGFRTETWGQCYKTFFLCH